MLEFYTIFARSMPEFTLPLPEEKYFFRIFLGEGGGATPCLGLGPRPPPAKSGPEDKDKEGQVPSLSPM